MSGACGEEKMQGSASSAEMRLWIESRRKRTKINRVNIQANQFRKWGAWWLNQWRRTTWEMTQQTGRPRLLRQRLKLNRKTIKLQIYTYDLKNYGEVKRLKDKEWNVADAGDWYFSQVSHWFFFLNRHFWLTHLIHIAGPLHDVLEGSLARDVIHQKDPLRRRGGWTAGGRPHEKTEGVKS